MIKILILFYYFYIFYACTGIRSMFGTIFQFSYLLKY